ncbi:MAG: DUF6431 domain-containing protein [Acidimicrobiales bacterium]
MAVSCPCPVSVERYAAVGRAVPRPAAACPRCGERLRADGGYGRQVRANGRRHRVWVLRGRCSSCAASHALLPEFVLAHHLDTVDTIGAALVGQPDPALPATTVAGWRRRWRANRADLAVGAAAAHVALSGTIVTDDRAGSLPGLIVALWLAARERGAASATPWRSLNVITGMSWLARRRDSSWAGVGLVPVTARAP